MTATPNEELIDAAQAVLKPHAVEGRLFGDVASTLVTDRGTRYSGVCIDTASGTGFCAEHSANCRDGHGRGVPNRQDRHGMAP